MKKIEELSIKVTYKVGISELEVSDVVFNQLKEIANKGLEIDGFRSDYQDALLWIKDNVREDDCCDLSYEIEEIIDDND